jgi:hypothetical protein
VASPARTQGLGGGRTLNLHGTTTWSGTPASTQRDPVSGTGRTINEPPAVINDANASALVIEHNVGGPHVFSNPGHLHKPRQHRDDGSDWASSSATAGRSTLTPGRLRFVKRHARALGTINVRQRRHLPATTRRARPGGP